MNRAYEFLCSRSARTVDGPDPHNIVLILRTQSILFSRYGDGERRTDWRDQTEGALDSLL